MSTSSSFSSLSLILDLRPLISQVPIARDSLRFCVAFVLDLRYVKNILKSSHVPSTNRIPSPYVCIVKRNFEKNEVLFQNAAKEYRRCHTDYQSGERGNKKLIFFRSIVNMLRFSCGELKKFVNFILKSSKASWECQWNNTEHHNSGESAEIQNSEFLSALDDYIFF